MRTTSTLLLFLIIKASLFAQELPVISEPAVATLYRFYHNLVQLKLDPYDYNEYMISCDHCEIGFEDKTGEELAPNNFIVTVKWELDTNYLDIHLWNRSQPNVVLKTFRLSITDPPMAEVHLDGIASGGTCSRTPKKFTAQYPKEAPIKLFSDIDIWQMIIGEKIVYGDGDEINDYARSILSELPSGKKIEFKCRSVDEDGIGYYLHAEFTLE